MPLYALHLGPTWRLVDGPWAFRSVADGGLSKQADKLPRIPPLCLGTHRVAEGPTTKPANSGSAGTEGTHTHTLAPSHFLASSSFPLFSFVLIFHCQLLLIPLPLGKVSLRTNRLWGAFVSTQFSFFRLGGDCSWPSFEDDLKWSPQMGLFWLISTPSVAPYRKQCYFDKKSNKWPMFNRNLL